MRLRSLRIWRRSAADESEALRFLAEIGDEETSAGTVRLMDGRVFERFTAPLRIGAALSGRVWSYRDISDRVSDQQRLALAGEVTRTVFWEIDFDADQLRVDAERLRDLNIATDPPIQRLSDWVGRIHPDDRDRFVHGVAKAVLPGAPPFDMEYRACDVSGDWAWIHTRAGTVRRDAQGRSTRVVGTAMNITARKAAESVLREQDSRLAAVFQASPLPSVITRLVTGEVLDVNDAGLLWFGAPREQVIGRSVDSLQLYPNPSRRAAMMAALEADGTVDAFPVEVRQYNGELRAVEVFGRIVPINGERCVVAVVSDVTERQRFEERRLQAQKLEALGTLAGGIAHDFNNILADIRGNADLAADELASHPVAVESLAEIQKATVRASDLVRRIMLFGRPKETRHEVVDLRLVVDEVLRLLRSTLPAGILLRTEFSPATPRAWADAGQVHEVVVNLTTNAAHAIGAAAGTITYRVEPVTVTPGDAAGIPGLEPGHYVRLSVVDTGSGIDPARLERICDAFYTTKPQGEGTGLGLSVVHGIMRSHGGAVTAESAVGAGSTFAVYFRQATDGRGAVHVPPATPASAPGARVLFVDDEPALAEMARKALPRFGHVVTAFTNPQQAVEYFAADADDIDVVVTDLSMPQLSGFEVARLVRTVRAVPVILTTGWVRGQDEETARDAGIAELVLKPVSMSELSQTMARVLDAGDSAAASDVSVV